MLFSWGWTLMEEDIPGCLCVAHVFVHVLKYQKSTEQNPALHCKTKTLLVSLDMGGKVEAGLVWGFATCQRCQSPSRQIVCVSWGMEREALLWFWSTDQCQAWSTSSVLWRGGRQWGGLKDLGTWNLNDVDFFPRLSPSRPLRLRRVRAAATVLAGRRGVWFQALGLLFGSLGAHDFRVTGSCLRRAPAASPLAMITPDAHTSPTPTPTLHLNQAAGTDMTLLSGLDCCNVYTTGDIWFT